MVIHQCQGGPESQPFHAIAARRHQLIGHGLRLLVQHRGMLRIARVDRSATGSPNWTLAGHVLRTERDRVLQGLIGFAPLALLQQR